MAPTGAEGAAKTEEGRRASRTSAIGRMRLGPRPGKLVRTRRGDARGTLDRGDRGAGRGGRGLWSARQEPGTEGGRRANYRSPVRRLQGFFAEGPAPGCR